MSVTISGYVSFTCSRCGKPHNIDAQTITFREDTSPECEEDEYIRYTSQVETMCEPCSNALLIRLDIWEYPAAVCNYSYYSEIGVSDIECEFTIEHFFDDTIAKLENTPYENEAEEHNEHGTDEEKQFNETQTIEGYTDQYDDTE